MKNKQAVIRLDDCLFLSSLQVGLAQQLKARGTFAADIFPPE